MELVSIFFSDGEEDFEFFEFAKRKKKKADKKGKGLGFLLAPLRPWRPFIAKGLQNMGINLVKKGKGLKAAWYLDNKKLSFGQLVWLFGEVVVKGKAYDKQNFEDFSHALETIEYANEVQGPGAGARTAGAAADLAVKAATFDVAGLTTSLIQAIINFIKKLRDKKRNGEKLTPLEERLANAYDTTEGEVIENVKDEANRSAGEVIFSPTTWLILAAAIVAGFLLLRKK